jgi:hypothetical protein
MCAVKPDFVTTDREVEISPVISDAARPEFNCAYNFALFL